MDALNRIEHWFPRWALKREKARVMLKNAKRLYDAAQPSPYHPPPRGGTLSGDALMDATGNKLRSEARLLDENHDLAVGVLNTLVDNIVGDGIEIEPMVRQGLRTPTLAENVNRELRTAWRRWWRNPEATGEYPGHTVERLACLSWLRDGEVLVRHWEGPGIAHNSDLPYTIQLLEADFLPFTEFNTGEHVQGVEKDDFGRPIAYHLYVRHPGNTGRGLIAPNLETVRIPADRITHLKHTRRIRQTRGVPILHAVIRRLDDIKDMEESERIAARLAAAFCAVITRDAAFEHDTGYLDAGGDRTFEMQGGQVFDKMLPGERVETLDSKRPNNQIIDFRNSQLRAVASGTGTSYSSIAKSYDGTYSAQRQELVESQPAYLRLSQIFVDVMMRDIYRRFVDMATLSGMVMIPAAVDRRTLYEASMVRGGGVPWIDPLKEVQADAAAVDAGFMSRQQVIRRRGGDPVMVTEELEADDYETASEQSAPVPPPAPAADDDEDDAA